MALAPPNIDDTYHQTDSGNAEYFAARWGHAVRRDWEVDIRVELPDGTEHRQRRRAPMSSKSAAQRWGEDRERIWYDELRTPQPKLKHEQEVPTLKEFWPRFIEGHARANRQKPSGIAAKEMVARVHLLPRFGDERLDAVSTERVQQLKASLAARAPKTVNNVLTVLNMMLKKAVEWGEIDRVPCSIRLLPVPPPSAPFHDFEDYERLVAAARVRGHDAYLVVLLGGEAGLRRGEIAALQWIDVDVRKRQLCVQRSVWKGHVEAPKGGKLRYVPLTQRLSAALQVARHLRAPWVFCDRGGQRLTEKDIGDHVDHAARRAGLKHRGIHILRHTFCSHLAMRGAPARAIQELAGHADLRTTQRYMHLSPAALEGAIRLLDQPGRPGVFGDIVETGVAEITKSSG
jgi:integrase